MRLETVTKLWDEAEAEKYRYTTKAPDDEYGLLEVTNPADANIE